ncbi:MAG: hypothetical protein A2Y33_04380 [Spirochaetes bacterium GWF1_51_8]|nr:MAG: hypothetical protein A2Y33_04380 [Spirochaetes bacterium GWF1_51_8]
MKIIISFIFGLLLTVKVFGVSPDYPSIFAEDFTKALNVVNEIKGQVFAQCKLMSADAELILPIVFPELLRYSLFRDSMEIVTMELFYISFGSGVNDFSVGIFQMKPSFVERMENLVSTNDAFKEFRNLLKYGNPQDLSAVRKERLSRLMKLQWQITYLLIFSKIALHFYPPKPDWTKEYMIRFYSCVYNTGFWRTEEFIRQTMELKIFPHGMGYIGEQYNYSDISVYFYENYWKNMVKEWGKLNKSH